MTAFIFGALGKYLAVGGAAFLALITALFAARRSGAKSERAKLTKAQLEASEELHEMHREADKIERDNAALADARAREKAKRVVG